ncbi:MAG: alanine--tRNA ligase [Bdellovibrionales bacterium]|nr:alanine--tRNA ligase [Bdellovibrionales bacterium]
MKHVEIRKNFKNFFDQQKHTWIKSASLIPFNDPSLLFVNAGMNPFKNILLGLESTEYKSVATIQKCVRAGGKHNDLEQVGPSPYHHTFFEMMGNFSFGNYFKEEACDLAWTFLTKNLNIPKENLAVSVFKKDKETAEIWNKKINVPKEKIFLFGEEDNFWRMGDSGPCGPCSEIYFDFEAFRSGSKSMVEVWNLVFMEYNEDSNKKKTALSTKCIDTGMGLERLAMILQNKKSNYHTDLFLPIIDSAGQITKTPYRENTTDKKEQTSNAVLRAIADHTRAGVFIISDGVYPSNEGRGYVLRRILRRALYLTSTLTDQKPVFKNIAEAVIKNYFSAYPELHSHTDTILESLQIEEEKFFHTLTQGKSILEKELFELEKKNKKVLSGDTSFKLYDTYGFPFDLVQLICKQASIQVDQTGFEQKLQESRLRSKKAGFSGSAGNQKSSIYKEALVIKSNIPGTKFIGYEHLESTSKIQSLFDENNSSVSHLKAPCTALAVFDQTCFYAEGGGQIGDKGDLVSSSSKKTAIAQITDCQNIQNKYVHTLSLKEGELKTGHTYLLKVSPEHRKQTAIHHSATHLLHSALRKILGPQTKQAGSLVEPRRLRFDFTYNKALTEEELVQVEDLVNEQVYQAEDVEVSYKKYDKALKDGALSFFEKPSLDKVRVLKMGDFSHELCGGTHVQNTKDILFLKIMSESSLSSGVRRIEAVCGKRALNFMNHLVRENIKVRKALSLPSKDSSLLEAVQKIKDSKKLKKNSSIDLSSLSLESFTLNSKKGVFHCAVHPSADHEFLSAVSDQIKKKYPLAITVIIGENVNTTPIVVALPKEISEKIKAQDIIKNLGGKGGGPPHFAKGALKKSFSREGLRQKTLDCLYKIGYLIDLN